MGEERSYKQYDYSAISNLVQPSNSSLIDKRPSNEATGEIQSLAGRIGGKMGDRVAAKPATKLPETKRQKSKKSDLLTNFTPKDMEAKDFLYQPKTEQTREVYEYIIKFVKNQLGFQHESIINGATDEVIRAMKKPNLTEDSKRFEINQLLSEVDDDDFNKLSNLCKKINDLDTEKAEEDSGDVGVILVDDDDNLSDDYVGEVQESGDEDSDFDEILEKSENENQIKKRVLDLDDLSKRQMNICPKINPIPSTDKGHYLEYHIVPKKRTTHKQDILKRLDELPDIERAAFKELETLNPIQSKIYRKALESDQSLLICAPTGAGKTVIAILTMLREIKKHVRGDGSIERSGFKIIYIAPMKALVQEVVENLRRRLGSEPYKLKVDEFTGDHQLDQAQLERCQVIVCTPEKWDIVTRKSVDRLYTKKVKLVIFDEIHLLHNDRGATLEALVARIKRHKQIEGDPIRIIGLSATLPNYRDVSRFIAPNEPVEESTFYFDSTYRPIPLRQQYIAIKEAKKFRMINDIVYEKVMERLAEHAQILIFVHSRTDTTKTGEFIKVKACEEDRHGLLLSSESAKDKINDATRKLAPKLKELLQYGIGVHHAGMSKDERHLVEELFRGKYVRVLVSTATLAWGVNLPARTVIIKGTQVYREGKWTDLDSLDVCQMLGRAGRPGFDKEGEGIVITDSSQVDFYMSLMTEQLPVESKLIGRLADFINAECVIGNIESINDAINWLSETYLSSRMLSVLRQDNNRQHLSMYGIDRDAKDRDPKLTSHRRNLAMTAASILDERGLIIFDTVGGIIKSTELGRIASHYNCTSKTIKLFYDSIKEHTSDIELFRTFSLAEEFKDLYVRRGEETDIQQLINEAPWPIDDKRATPGANKVNALLQNYILRSMKVEIPDLVSDMQFIKDNAARLAAAIHEIALMKGFARVSELTLDLSRKIDKRMTANHTPLRQFDDELDRDVVNKLEKKHYNIDELRVLKEDKLRDLLRCDAKQGHRVFRLLTRLPKLKLEASVKPVSKTSLKIDLTIEPEFTWDKKFYKSTVRFWLFVEDNDQELLLHHEQIQLKTKGRGEKEYLPSNKITTTFYVPYMTDPYNPFYYIKVFPEGWFGCDQYIPVHIAQLRRPNEITNFTQPLNLEPQTVSSLEDPLFEAIYREKFRGASFNQIQTQAFRHLYSSNSDIILLASAGSGKTTCAEIALMRNIKKHGQKSKSAFVAANHQAAQLIFKQWSETFGTNPLDRDQTWLSIVLLSGNLNQDMKSLKKGEDEINIIIGDPQSWYNLMLARGKKRKQPNGFLDWCYSAQLFIIDQIHLVNSDQTSILEWLCAKIRIATESSLKAEKPRLIVMGSPMICAESLKDWLATSVKPEPVLLNYPPSLRAVNMELTIQKFYQYNHKMRLLSMQRPAYRYLTQNAGDKSVLIFVADYNSAKSLAEAIVNYSRREGRRMGCRLTRFDDVYDTTLVDCLRYGVGYIYSGMDPTDRYNVERWHRRNDIQILVATVATCWSLETRSYVTIVVDTQHYDGHKNTDFELTDIIQMVGLTGRPSDLDCRCTILCHSSKAEHYERFLREPLQAESSLPSNLIGYFNYEIASKAIKELDQLYKPYIDHTFLYKRISINPNYYGVIPDESDGLRKELGAFFNKLANDMVEELKKSQFISEDDDGDYPKFSPTQLAELSLGDYIHYETLAHYSKWLRPNTKTRELIQLLSYSFEFRGIIIRHCEVQALEGLKDRYKLFDSSLNKVELLLYSQRQKTDGKEDPVEGELVEDRYQIISMSYRLIMAIARISYLNDFFSVVKGALKLAQAIAPFKRDQPNLDVYTKADREDDELKITINVNREDDPFCYEEFRSTHRSLPLWLYREEGWYILIHAKPKSETGAAEEVLLFEPVRAPSKGATEYKSRCKLPENSHAYTYDFHLISDFYSGKVDRAVLDFYVDGANE